MTGNVVISIQNERDLAFLSHIFFQSKIELNTISFADFSTEPESVLSIGITSPPWHARARKCNDFAPTPTSHQLTRHCH